MDTLPRVCLLVVMLYLVCSEYIRYLHNNRNFVFILLHLRLQNVNLKEISMFLSIYSVICNHK